MNVHIEDFFNRIYKSVALLESNKSIPVVEQGLITLEDLKAIIKEIILKRKALAEQLTDPETEHGVRPWGIDRNFNGIPLTLKFCVSKDGMIIALLETNLQISDEQSDYKCPPIRIDDLSAPLVKTPSLTNSLSDLLDTYLTESGGSDVMRVSPTLLLSSELSRPVSTNSSTADVPGCDSKAETDLTERMKISN